MDEQEVRCYWSQPEEPTTPCEEWQYFRSVEGGFFIGGVRAPPRDGLLWRAWVRLTNGAEWDPDQLKCEWLREMTRCSAMEAVEQRVGRIARQFGIRFTAETNDG